MYARLLFRIILLIVGLLVGSSPCFAQRTSASSGELLPRPTGLVARIKGESIVLTWKRDPRATSYEIIVKVGEETESVPTDEIETASLKTPTVEYQDLSIVRGVKQEYRVIAKNARGSSPESAPASAIVRFRIPSPPTQIKAVAGGDRVMLVWDESNEAYSFVIYRRHATEATFTRIGTSEDPAYTDEKVVSGQEYFYAIAGANPDHVSKLSAPIAVTATPAVQTAQEVIQIARTFASAVQQPVTEMPEVAFPHAPDSVFVSTRNWHRRWQVNFPGQAEFEIADDTGAVTFYHNLHQEDGPTTSRLAEGEVQQTMKSVLALSGLPEQFGEAQVTRGTEAASEVFVWYVHCPRMFQGMPVEESYVLVQLNGDGILRSLSAVLPFDNPSTVAENISQEQARQIAMKFLTARLRTDVTYKASRKVVVLPNGHRISSRNLPTTPRIAWSVFLSTGEAQKDPVFHFVWVDIETGAVLGGDQTASHGESEPSAKTSRVSAKTPAWPSGKPKPAPKGSSQKSKAKATVP